MKEIIDYGERKCIVFDETIPEYREIMPVYDNRVLINGIDTNFIVFNKPIKEYYDLALIAASSNDPLSHNYRKPIHKDKEFMTLVTMKDRPVFMFGTEKDPSLPDNVARGFVRTFMDPDIRRYDCGKGKGKYTQFFIYFYNLFPQYHKALGIDTIFFTRNYTRGRNERGSEWYFRPMNFFKYPDVLMYHQVPQWFFVHGDPSFCDTLPKYNEASE